MPRRLHIDQALGDAVTDKRLEILRRVADCGSISQAARAVGVSYKAAWQALDTLSNLAGVPLVERAIGGAGGGGARLTPAGEQLLHASDAMARSRRQVLARLSPRAGTQPLAALALRTSMRNQLPCAVADVMLAAPLAQVALRLAAGGQLVARITAESAELLALAPGQEVLLLCKATAVRIARAGSESPTSENTVAGRAVRVARGPGGDEVAVELPGGLRLVGFAPPGSRMRIGLRVRAVIDPAALVIAVPG